MNAHDHAERAHELLDLAVQRRFDVAGDNGFAEVEEAENLERQASAHATTALAMMLCQQSVCGHGVLQTHDDQRPDSMCRP